MSLKPLEEIYNSLIKFAETIQSPEFDFLVKDLRAHIEAEEEKKAAKEWKKGTGEIAFEKGKITVTVYRHDNYPGIIIHQRYDPDGRLSPKWYISHEPSGLRLGSKDYPTMRKAVRTFLEHAAEINWNRPKEEIINDPEAEKAYYGLTTGVKHCLLKVKGEDSHERKTTDI